MIWLLFLLLATPMLYQLILGYNCNIKTNNGYIAMFMSTCKRKMSGSRIKTAGRFKPCAHIGCFDLETFVQLNQRSRKWQCPICLKNYSLEDITIDPYFNRITKMVQDCGEDATEIDVKPDGSWRVKIGYQFRNLEQWHLPNGSICVSGSEVVPNLEASRHLRDEGIVGDREPRDTQTAFRNQPGEHDSQNIITMSSSSSDSFADDGDCTVNDDGSDNGHDIGTISYKMGTTTRDMNRNTDASLGHMDVIVLSDSEEENANVTSPQTLSLIQEVNYGGHFFPAPPATFNEYPEDPALDAGVSSSLGLFNSSANDFEMSDEAFGCGTQAGSPLQLFHCDTQIDPEYTPFTSSVPFGGYTLTSKCPTEPGRQLFDSSACHSNTKINDSLSDLGNNLEASKGICGETTISVGLGSNNGDGNAASGLHAEPTTSKGLDLVSQFESNEALLPLTVNDEIKSNGTTEGNISAGPFSFPRQPRSARRRCLS